jgi:hypothetical protein
LGTERISGGHRSFQGVIGIVIKSTAAEFIERRDDVSALAWQSPAFDAGCRVNVLGADGLALGERAKTVGALRAADRQ